MSNRLRRCLTLYLVSLLLYAYSPHAVTANEIHERSRTGDLSAFGHVLLDREEAVTGTTFFSGNVILTGEGARAVLGLNTMGRAELLPESSLRVFFRDEGISATLGTGGVRFSKPAGVSVVVTTGDGSVEAEHDGDAIFIVKYIEGRTVVESEKGRVQLRLEEKDIVVASGERYEEGQDISGISNSLSGKKKVGIFLGIGGGIALLVAILTAGTDEDASLDFGGPIDPSPSR